ncbi:MAG: copper-binding protein [Caulobacter sp.]|jgi:hypothetical protein|nr:copper-binding protein [Caulobacter sp.]
MKTITAVVLAALALSACGQKPAADGDLKSAKARALVIPPGPTGPVLSMTGTVVAVDGRTVTLDHDGVEGLAAGRTSFRTWADVIAASPGEPGARVAFKVQKLGDGWALVEMTAR